MKMLRLTLRNGDKVDIPENALEHYKKTWEEIMTKAEQRGLSREETRAYEVVSVEEIET